MCVNTVRRYYIYARESVKRRRRGQRTSPYTDGQSEKKRKAQHPPKHRYYISGRTTDGNRSDGFKVPLQRTEYGHGYIRPPAPYTDGQSGKKKSVPPPRPLLLYKRTDNGRNTAHGFIFSFHRTPLLYKRTDGARSQILQRRKGGEKEKRQETDKKEELKGQKDDTAGKDRKFTNKIKKQI